MYAGSFVYEDIDNDAVDDFNLDYILNPEGKIDKLTSSVEYHYNLQDHLGNTRVVFDGDGTVKQKTDYYPFGMTSYQSSTIDNKYLYNGKELQDEQLGGINLDWYSYGARYYDPALARWHVMDPMTEEYISWSPYNYTLNNPILFVDPDGNKVKLWYREQSAKGGGVVGAYAFRQWGTAKDDYGHTWYQFSSKSLARPWKKGMVLGGDVDVIEGGFAISRNDKSFREFANSQEFPASLTIGPFDVSANFNGYFSLSGGASLGMAYSMTPVDEVTSFSFTKEESRNVANLAGGKSFVDVDYMSIEPMKTKNDNGELVENSSKGELILSLPGEDPINTGIIMNSPDNNNQWESMKYFFDRKTDQ